MEFITLVLCITLISLHSVNFIIRSERITFDKEFALIDIGSLYFGACLFAVQTSLLSAYWLGYLTCSIFIVLLPTFITIGLVLLLFSFAILAALFVAGRIDREYMDYNSRLNTGRYEED